MPDLKFSCSQCGQHISCDEAWSGHAIQCPACNAGIRVPQAQTPAAPVPKPPALPAASAPRLSAGLTQVPRPSPTSPIAQKRAQPRPPKSTNPALRYAGIAVALLVLGGVALKFLPGLLNQVQDIGAAKSSGSAGAPVSGAAGPLGEVNGTMDVSDALDGGSSRSRPVATRQPAAGPANRASATNNVRNRAR